MRLLQNDLGCNKNFDNCFGIPGDVAASGGVHREQSLAGSGEIDADTSSRVDLNRDGSSSLQVRATDRLSSSEGFMESSNESGAQLRNGKKEQPKASQHFSKKKLMNIVIEFFQGNESCIMILDRIDLRMTGDTTSSGLATTTGTTAGMNNEMNTQLTNDQTTNADGTYVSGTSSGKQSASTDAGYTQGGIQVASQISRGESPRTTGGQAATEVSGAGIQVTTDQTAHSSGFSTPNLSSTETYTANQAAADRGSVNGNLHTGSYSDTGMLALMPHANG